jgi:hypothetical protein
MNTTEPTPDFDYSGEQDATPVGDNLLARINGLAADQLQSEARVARLEEELTEAKSTARLISEVQMPELLKEAGMSEFTTADGIRIALKEQIFGSIPAATAEEAFSWLEENGHARLIKRTFAIDFGKDDEKWADKFERDLAQRKKPLNCKRKRAVHPQTLRAFVREQLDKGVAIPMDTFGVHCRNVSKVTVKE